MPPPPSPELIESLNRAVESVRGLPLAAAEANRRFIERWAAGADGVVLVDSEAAGSMGGLASASSPSALLELREQLTAFVGPSYARFAPGPGPLSKDRRVEAILATAFPPTCIRFAVAARHATGAANALLRMSEVLLRVRVVAEPLQSTSRGHLRAFHLALAAGDRSDAERRLSVLGGAPEMAEANLTALRVQLLTRFGAWRELLGLPELPALLIGGQPPALRIGILRAFHQERMAWLEAQGRFDLAAAAFRGQVLPECLRLLSVRAGLDHPDCRRLLAYQAGHQRDEAARDALSTAADPSEQSVITAIYAAAASAGPIASPPQPTPTPVGGPLIRAMDLFDSGDIDAAYELLVAQPNGGERAALLAECALEINTLSAWAASLEAMDSLPAEARSRLLKNPRVRRAREGILQALAESQATARRVDAISPPPTNWVGWFELLDNPGSLDLERIAARGAVEWSAWEPDAATVARLETAISLDREGEARQVFHDSMGHLVGWLQSVAPDQLLKLAPICHALLFRLMLEHECNASAVQLILEMVRVRFELGVGPSDVYRRLTDDLADLWRQLESPRFVVWLLELVEMVADYPAPDIGAQSATVRLLTGAKPGLLARLSVTEWEVLRQVCVACSMIEDWAAARHRLPPPPSADADEAASATSDRWRKLAGRCVGIYSLETPSARRAGEVIRERCPSCRVELNHDYVGTKPLRDMARSSDVVVMVVRAAQHAATNAIQQERGGRPLLRPMGKGAASILRELETHLATD